MKEGGMRGREDEGRGLEDYSPAICFRSKLGKSNIAEWKK